MTREEAEKIALEKYPVSEQTFKSDTGEMILYDVTTITQSLQLIVYIRENCMSNSVI